VRFCLVALLLLLAACDSSRESSRESRSATFIGARPESDIDTRLFQLETLRLQRDALENDRLRLWLDHRGGVSVVSRPRRR
jgi:lipoprotein NlpI